MATTPALQNTGDVAPSSWANDVRTAITENPAYLASAAGEVPYASAAGVLAMLSPTGNGGKFIRFNAAENALEAASVKVTAGVREWGEKVATLYTALFTDDPGAGSTGIGVAHGWAISGSISNTELSPSGDLGVGLTDYTPRLFIRLTADNSYVLSPSIIGDAALMRMIRDLLLDGTAVTTIRVDVFGKFNSTADVGANVEGFGLFDPASPGTLAGDIIFRPGATNFEVNVQNGTDQDTGVAKDGAWHKFSIILDVAGLTADFEIDDVSVVTNQAIAQDEWPVAVGFFSVSASIRTLDLMACAVEFS